MRAAFRIDGKTGLPFLAVDPTVRGWLSELGVDVSPLTGRFEPYQWKIDRSQSIVGREPQGRSQRYVQGYHILAD